MQRLLQDKITINRTEVYSTLDLVSFNEDYQVMVECNSGTFFGRLLVYGLTAIVD